MKYIVCEDFSESYGDSIIGIRYVGLSNEGDESKLSVYFNPNKAILFDTKDDAEKFKKEVCNKAEYGKVVSLGEALVRWQKIYDSGFYVSSFNKTQENVLKPLVVTGDSAIDKPAFLSWWLKEYQPNISNIPQEVYSENTCNSFKVFQHLIYGCVWKDTGQAVITINLSAALNTDELVVLSEDIDLAIPYIKPATIDWLDDNSYENKIEIVRFGIMEPNLSEHASYRIEHSVLGWRLAYTRYHRSAVEFSCSLNSTSTLAFLTKVHDFFHK
jgi:hypothetical protein